MMQGLRITVSKETVKELVAALQKAYKSGDARLIQRIQVLLDFSRGEAVDTLAERHGVSVSSVYAWLKQLLAEGVSSLKPRWKGGRPPKLTPSQKRELAALVDTGPEAAGFASACWNSALIQQLIQQRFGVTYNVHYICELLKTLGFSFQKARFVADHLNDSLRQQWLQETWPQIRRQAQAVGGLLLFGDEASFAQWGSLSYTWARRGQQPTVKTSGQRKGYKVFGLMDYFTGQFFYQGIEGRFNADSYIAFLQQVLAQTTAPIVLIQDGASYHIAKKTKHFFATHADRLTVYQLPSYSPDFNPIEYRWRHIKRTATHLKYFPTFTNLVQAVEHALAEVQAQPTYVRGLCGRYHHLDAAAHAHPAEPVTALAA